MSTFKNHSLFIVEIPITRIPSEYHPKKQMDVKEQQSGLPKDDRQHLKNNEQTPQELLQSGIYEDKE